MHVELINHACVKIRTERACILIDPWLEGTAFNDGWRHLVATPAVLPRLMDGVTHIWLSHEHPDHFSTRFFLSIAKDFASRVDVLFQKTRDGRVKRFLEGRGFEVREIDNSEVVQLEDCQIRVGRHGFYDSWLLVRDANASVLNLNDCPIRRDDELKPLKRQVGDIDVLLTQFSYAAWKGGRDHAAYRREAAQEKLATIRKQIEGLRPRRVIPFASMVYFSNVENFYLNDSINTPEDAARTIAQAGAEPIVMFPGDSWEIGQPRSNDDALERYAEVYCGLTTLPLDSAGESVDIAELAKRFAKYRERVYRKNSAFFIRLARIVPLGGAFRSVNIRLSDLDKTVSVSIVDGFRADDGANAEVWMHSSSLAFIFDQEFGFDTLTVNGRFEAKPDGFSKMVGAFGIGSLNAMGLSLSLSLFGQMQVLLVLMRLLSKVMARLRAGGARRSSET
jgi:UDP-MurNAc hydroxylase